MKTNKLLFFSSVLLSFFIFQNCSTNETTSNDSNQVSDNIVNVEPNFEKQIINPPISNIDVAFNSFQIENAKAKTISLPNGTSIEIPANAFVDTNGQPVTSNVNVQYREFHTAADIIASGIPMKAKHNGQVGNMETAGMFEIRANANHEQLSLAEGKDIKVNMASNVGGNDFDFWYFDEEKGNWDNRGQSTPQSNLVKTQAKKVLASLAKVIAPAKPVEFDKKKPVLNFDINVEEYPELKEMDGVFWQYTGKGENPESAKWIFDEEWDYANIEKTNAPNEYQLELKNKNKNFKTRVCPSQKDASFDKAMESYNSKMNDYKNNSLTQQQNELFVKQQADFIRSMRINDMGIHNYDILWKNPMNILVDATFDFGNSVKSSQSKVNVYLVCSDGRQVVAYPYSDWKKFGFDPRKENQIVAILPNNKIATFEPEDFLKYKSQLEASKGKSFEFKMNVRENSVDGINELNKVLAADQNLDASNTVI